MSWRQFPTALNVSHHKQFVGRYVVNVSSLVVSFNSNEGHSWDVSDISSALFNTELNLLSF